MRKIILSLGFVAFLFGCNNSSKTETTTDSGASKEVKSSFVELPYKASYSSNFTQDISDADLKTVLQSYKDWETGNMTGLANAMADSVEVDFNNGDHFSGKNADLLKIWTTLRDSLSSVKIDMEGWHKMYEPDKKAAFIVTWYKETDTYKTGKVDSASYHDINLLKNGKISAYAQYKRPAK